MKDLSFNLNGIFKGVLARFSHAADPDFPYGMTTCQFIEKGTPERGTEFDFWHSLRAEKQINGTFTLFETSELVDGYETLSKADPVILAENITVEDAAKAMFEWESRQNAAHHLTRYDGEELDHFIHYTTVAKLLKIEDLSQLKNNRTEKDWIKSYKDNLKSMTKRVSFDKNKNKPQLATHNTGKIPKKTKPLLPLRKPSHLKPVK